MKRIIVAVVAVLLSLGTATAQSDNSILKGGVEIYGISARIRFIPFSDGTGKFGFVRNISNLSVIVKPKYEDMLCRSFLLVGVKENGLWGAVDMGARYLRYSLCEPIIPCVYKNIEIESDDAVICDGLRIDITQLGYEKNK